MNQVPKSLKSAQRWAPVLAGTFIAVLCASAPIRAADIVYTISQSGTTPIVAGESSPLSDTVSGSITTDGKFGVLQSSDILSWNLQLIDNITPVNDFTLTPTNSALIEDSGSALSANATALSFDFSTAGAEFLIQGNVVHGVYSGYNYFCFSATGGACAAGETIVPQSYTTDGVLVQGLSGTLPLQPPTATAPEIDPASAMAGFTLLFGGLAVMRGRRRSPLHGVPR